jgi:hypothetical protein
METVTILYKQLLEKQERDLLCAKQNSKRRLAVIESEIAKQNDHYRLAIRQLRVRMENSNETRSSGLPRLRPTGATTVQRKLAEYRRSLVPPVLAVKLDMKSILANVRLSH